DFRDETPCRLCINQAVLVIDHLQAIRRPHEPGAIRRQPSLAGLDLSPNAADVQNGSGVQIWKDRCWILDGNGTMLARLGSCSDWTRSGSSGKAQRAIFDVDWPSALAHWSGNT